MSPAPELKGLITQIKFSLLSDHSFELLYGYPVGNFPNNVVKTETKYMIDTSYKINGEKKKAGDMDVEDVVLVYNENNYPSTMKQNEDVDDSVQMVYTCE